MARPRVQLGPAALPANTAACVGAFDGFHLGHQTLLARARELAARVAVVTFDPHPAEVLAPNQVPGTLCPGDQRERVLAHLGVDDFVLLPFDATVARLSPERFVAQYFTAGLRPTHVVVGDDFRFGHRRTGTTGLLARELARAGIELEVVPRVPPPPAANSSELSSSAIRRALHNGDVASAGAMLGRWYGVTGAVVCGARRGRELGFPTANIRVQGGLLPAPGIYATTLGVLSPHSPHHGALWPAASSLGRNPTFERGANAPLVLESHVLDADLGESLYDCQVEVSFVGRLRDEQTYDDVDALVAQVMRDIARTRSLVDARALALALPPTP